MVNTLRDPDDVKHIDASRGGTLVTWCERADNEAETFWLSHELRKERGIPTCLRCLGLHP